MGRDVDLGVQLFSVRDHLGEELEGTLVRLAEIGFTHIEPYDILSDPAALRHAMQASGVRAVATHASIQGPDRDRIIESAGSLGIGTVIVPWVNPDTFADRGDVVRLADQINEAARVAAGAGIRVGYHNHEFEFNHAIDGRPGYLTLVDLLDEGIILELDTFWSSVGGTDPLELLPTLADRVRYLHVAAGPPDPTKPPLLGGDGTLHLPEIIASGSKFVEMVVVEVVTARPIFAALQDNFDYFYGVLSA